MNENYNSCFGRGVKNKKYQVDFGKQMKEMME